MSSNDEPLFSESRATRRGRLVSMGTAYAMGTFNDNFFKQAALLLAAIAHLEWIQGVATALFALPFVLFSSWGGWLADAFPKKTVIVRSKYLELGAMLLGTFTLCATGFIPHWWGMVAVVFLMGLQSTFFSPALNGAIPENFPAPEVPRVNALMKLATTLTILLGFSLAGVVLELPAPAFILSLLPEGPLPFGRVAIGVFAILVSVVGILAAYGIRKSREKERSKAPFPWLGPVDSCRHLLECQRKDATLCLVVIGEAFFYCISSFVLLCIPNLGELFGFSLTVTSILSAALAVGICIGSVLAGRHEASVWRRFMIPAGAGMAFGMIAAACAPLLPSGLRPYWLLAAFIFAGTCGGFYLIPLVSFIQIRPSAGEKGKVIAISNFSSFCGILLSGLVFTPLGSLHPALLLGGAALVIITFMSWAGWRLHSLPGKTLADTRGCLLGFFLRLCLGLRYRVTTRGLENIAVPGKDAVLFLPNHPALVDPIIIYSQLAGVKPRPLADKNQLKGVIGGLAARIIRAVRIPDLRRDGVKARSALETGMEAILNALHNGDPVLFYPAGRLYREKKEMIGGNSGVASILQSLPDVRVVLVRTTGLWGSAFSYAATGKAPSLARELLRGIAIVFANLIFFTPRREVTVEFIEPGDIPRDGDKRVINPWLEGFYSAAERPAMAVPRFFWQGKTPYSIKDFSARGEEHRDIVFPPALCEAVYAALRETADLPPDHPISEEMNLSADLGLDSLGIMNLSLGLEAVQGVPVSNLEALITVRDCLLAASGKLGGEGQKGGVPGGWFSPASRANLAFPATGSVTIPDTFLNLVREAPLEPLCAERNLLRTRRDILTGALALSGRIRSLEGTHIGIMLPSIPAVTAVWLASLLAGKVPVFLNWTVGEANMRHCVALAGLRYVLTASALLARLDRQGFVAENIPVEWLPLEKMAKSLGLIRKITGAIKARFLRSFAGYDIPETAALLFTSGSEAMPKAVPLTHTNLMVNARDTLDALQVTSDNTVLAMLPPFHSFGLMVDIVLPLTCGLRAAYYPNPTESGPLVAMVRDFKLSLLAAPPTFLDAMLERAHGTSDLASLRFAFVGAEKCPDRIYRSFAGQCPDAALCEGYGITECSPVISVNRPESVVPGSIGHALASVEAAVVREEDGRIIGHAGTSETGMLLVRGPSIFSGYFGDAPSPFVAFENNIWYRTGDLVSRDATGRFFFQGRLKRFVKIGGEMISLPQIEETLFSAFAKREDAPAGGPALAVEATPEESGPGIVLFTPMALSAQEANAALRAAGLAAIYSVRRVQRLEAIPLLGSGKTDYQALKKLLQNP